MTDPTADKMTMLIKASPEHLADIGLNIMQAIQEWNSLTPEQRQQQIMERDRRLAEESTFKCGDVLDVLTGLFDHRHTYACEAPLGHEGDHYGPELTDDYDEAGHREWGEDHPGRRANR